MNELETIQAAQITRLQQALVKLVAMLKYSKTLDPRTAEEIGEILKDVDTK